ncbi:MAG: hypothetical protein ACRCUC_15345, partial [Aestuariivirga sp.]
MINGVYRALPSALALALAILASLVVVLQPAAAGPYLDYATRLTQSPPDGAQYRPDLEEELAGLANAYRSQKGKPPLQAS